MTQEEKELLLKDLCARLPYGVKVKYYRDDCAGILDSDKALKWLKSIKDRVQPQPKQELSEEDDVIGKAIIAWLKATRYVPNEQAETLNSWIAWLEKRGEQKPNHRKPSEDQMLALETAIRCRSMPWEQLGTLYYDLKKL